MRIIISPAKKMLVDTDSLDCTSLPIFLPRARQLIRAMQKMDFAELQRLWQCSFAIAELNVQRLRGMDLQQNLTPAILSYEGIQYRYMAPGVFEDGHFDYINEHLRILSGFYGLLRPFDGVVPYRLEMQAKLTAGRHKDLYAFWGDSLSRQLCSESDFILNLASKEYSKTVTAHLPKNVRLLTCDFGEEICGKIIQKGTLCKMARGQMVRWLAQYNVTDPQDIRGFNDLGYAFSKEHSSQDRFVFIKGGEKDAGNWN